jgi:hypothetical protein
MTDKKSVFMNKWVRVVSAFVLFLLLLQTAFYFAADLFLRNYIQQKVKEASHNKYEIDFEEFHISLLQRGFSFKNLYLIPKEEIVDSLNNQPYYKVFVPEITFKGIFYRFQKKEILIGELKVKNPLVDFFMPNSNENITGLSTVKTLEEQIKKSFFQSSIKEVRIKKFLVQEADLLLKNFVSQREISADNANIYLEDVQLLKDRTPATPFNALGFQMSFDNFQMLLADSVHTIKAAEVNISSLEQIIFAQNIELIPDYTKESANYLNLQLDNLKLSEADINKVFQTSQVDVGSLVLHKPKIQILGQKNKQSQLLENFDFYALIDGILKEIKIANLKINEGQFEQKLIDEDFKRIAANEINFELMGIYIGPEAEKKQNQFFFAEDAQLDLQDVEVSLGKGTHLLKGAEVTISSLTDQISVKGLVLEPQISILNEDAPQYHIQVPELFIDQANLRKVYQEGKLDVKNIVFDSPRVLIQNLNSGNKISSDQIKMISEEYLQSVYIKNLEVKEGTFVMENNQNSKHDSLSFGKINLWLENFALDERTQDLPSYFLAEHLTLELQDYALKLADDLHIFKAKNLWINTKKSTLEIHDFSIAPPKKNQIKSLLDQYNKTSNLEIFIPKFKAYGLDYQKAFLESKLHVNRIHIPSPKISFTQHLSNQKIKNSEEIEMTDVLALLKFYFSEIAIQSLQLEKGSLNYENHTKEKLRTFAEDNINITVKNFKIDPSTKEEDVGNLFSEEIDISLNNYVFNLADGKYNIFADQVVYNSSKEEIITKNVRLYPTFPTPGQFGISAVIPSLNIKGIDLEAFLLDNTLQLNRLLLNDAVIHVIIDKDQVAKNQKSKKSRPIQLPKTIDIVSIDTIETLNSSFFLHLKKNKKENELINSKINMVMYDFHLDSVKLKKQNLNQLFSALTFSIDDFWLTLPDSIHRITFTKVALDTKYDGILLSNLKIIPENLSGEPGKPVFSGHIPTTLIKIPSLIDLSDTRKLEITDIQFYKPEIEIFTDNRTAQRSLKVQELPAYFQQAKLHNFEIVEGNLSLIDKNWEKKPLHFLDVNVQFSDLNMQFDELFPINKTQLLQKNFNISIPQLVFYSKDSLFEYKADWVNLKPELLQINNIRIHPVSGTFATNRKLGQQTDIPDLEIKNIQVFSPDYELFMDHQSVRAHKLLVNQLGGNLFRDKRYLMKPKKAKPLPQVLMENFPYSVYLDTLKVLDSYLIYTEFPKSGFIPGHLGFENIEFTAYPWIMGQTNSPKVPIHFQGKWLLNAAAPFKVNGFLTMEEPYRINLNAEVDGFYLKAFNSILETNVLAKINRGTVEKGTFQMELTNEEAKGTLILLYNDLEIELLDGRTLEKGKGKKNILTFIINNLAIKKNNPRKWSNKTHEGVIHYQRDDSRFVFNYIWNATLTGIKETLGFKNKVENKPIPKTQK